jgi:DNA polymerase
MAAGRQGSYKCLSWDKEVIYLPNGMTLKYPDLKKSTNEDGFVEWTYRSGDIRKKIYGAMLCENIVQALARIIVFGQMLVINRKRRVVLTTHDEVGALAKVGESKKLLDFMIETMRSPLHWCSDIPLNAEGIAEPYYAK